MNDLPTELARIEFLAGRLDRAISAAESGNCKRVSFDIEHAKELVAIVHDSLRTVKRVEGLVEFDGTIKPQRRLAST